jgi:plasmid stabilization system protein ParE
MSVRISARARDDLDHIYAWVCSRQGDQAADEFLLVARQAVLLLSQHPEAGPHPGWATRHQTLRFWVIARTRYVIFYFAEEDGVSIERVLDGRRDVKRIIQDRVEQPPDDSAVR